MDRYREAALEALAGTEEEPSTWFHDGHPWRPDLAAVEAVVGFEIGEDARTLWSHPLSFSDQLLPTSIFIPGPIALFLGLAMLRFGHLHLDVSRQLPLVHMAPDFGDQVIVADADDQSSLWVAGAGQTQSVSHPFQISLTEMFDSWTEALMLGELEPQNGMIAPAGPEVAFDVRSLDGAARRAYALLPGEAAGREELALASGGIVDDAHGSGFDYGAWLRSVERLSCDRVNAWEADYGELPFNDLKARLDDGLI